MEQGGKEGDASATEVTPNKTSHSVGHASRIACSSAPGPDAEADVAANEFAIVLMGHNLGTLWFNQPRSTQGVCVGPAGNHKLVSHQFSRQAEPLNR